MAETTSSIDVRLMRRVIRLRNLIAGPLAMGDIQHEPVMVEEVLNHLELRPGDVIVDGTLGLGGHALEFAQAIAPMGVLVGLDWDESMLARAKSRLGSPIGVRLELHHCDFRSCSPLLRNLSLRADAFFLDLGLNSAQVDDPERGISFRHNGPLDMRMDRSQGEPAAALLNRLSVTQIESMLKDFGDERWAKRIGQKIVERRKNQPLRTTQDLVDCVLAAIPVGARDKRIHPATRTFQAVRIYVNRELDTLDEGIREAALNLVPGGRMVVLSYHSGEDRIVKNVFRELANQGFREVCKRPIIPTELEVMRNPRSRSAKLRALVRDPES